MILTNVTECFMNVKDFNLTTVLTDVLLSKKLKCRAAELQ